MRISKYFVCLSAYCKSSGADSGKGRRELFWRAQAGRGRQGNLAQSGRLVACALLSCVLRRLGRRLGWVGVQVGAEGESKLASSLHTAGHQGQHTGVKARKEKKKKKKTGAGRQIGVCFFFFFFLGLVSL